MPHLLVFAPVSHVLEELAAMETIKFENQESTEEEAISKLSSQDMLLKDQLVEGKEILDSVPPLGGGNVVGDNSQPKIVDTYNIMMDLYARAGQFGEASKVFSDMGKAGVAPDIVTYNCMIHTCGRAGRVQEAKAIFKKIIEEGPVPNVATYNMLISMFIKRRDKKMALKYYQKMKAGGLTPDAVTFRIILRDTMISVADVGLRVDLSKHLTMMMEELAAGVGEYIHKSEITQTILLNLYKKSGEQLLTLLSSFLSIWLHNVSQNWAYVSHFQNSHIIHRSSHTESEIDFKLCLFYYRVCVNYLLKGIPAQQVTLLIFHL